MKKILLIFTLITFPMASPGKSPGLVSLRVIHGGKVSRFTIHDEAKGDYSLKFKNNRGNQGRFVMNKKDFNFIMARAAEIPDQNNPPRCYRSSIELTTHVDGKKHQKWSCLGTKSIPEQNLTKLANLFAHLTVGR
jgi:hypothetical protein